MPQPAKGVLITEFERRSRENTMPMMAVPWAITAPRSRLVSRETRDHYAFGQPEDACTPVVKRRLFGLDFLCTMTACAQSDHVRSVMTRTHRLSIRTITVGT
jgi:hypothetical protein